MGKVPKYTARAIDKYHAKFDRVAASLPKGTKDIINNDIGMSVNAYINELVRADLQRRGLLNAAEDLQEPPQRAPGSSPGDCPF